MNYIVCFEKEDCIDYLYDTFEAYSKKHAFMKFQNKILCAGRNINQYKVISIFRIDEFRISATPSINITSTGYVYGYFQGYGELIQCPNL